MWFNSKNYRFQTKPIFFWIVSSTRSDSDLMKNKSTFVYLNSKIVAILSFFDWNNHIKILGKFDIWLLFFHFFFIFCYPKKFQDFFEAVKKTIFWQKSTVHTLTIFPRNFWWLFQAKRDKIWLPRQKMLQVTRLLIFLG